MKQELLGNTIGHAALSMRDKFDLFSTALFYPERVGTLANDQLATRLITRICQSNKTFVDVGAHIGSILSEVMYNDPTIRIVAIEAIPEKVAKLRQRFPSVEFHNCAVGQSNGKTQFFINLSRSGYSSLNRPDKSTATISEIQVSIQRLDDLVSSHNIDAIKIDVEGAELGVLQGSESILKNCRPTIMFESAPQPSGNADKTKEALYQYLSSHQYAVLTPNRVAHNDDGLSEHGFLESHLYPRRTTNYFGLPLERRVELRDRARKILRIDASMAC
jgi:FkbM family methyltransferase